ncbi:hypothetical protein DC432_15655 [Microbacterium testaceum]|uniref:Uncharacterized protein n=1 Tax=Microbacterium testaceum TaxID=2033 RepID=A0A2T7VQ61_MICTE|nr:hypothetical protein DC432_15655 [Microbacterium testaceum]
MNATGDRGGSGNLAALCQRSNAIWWRVQNSSAANWLFNATGYDSDAHTIRQARVQAGDPPAAWDDRMAAYVSSRSWPSDAPAVLVCSAALGEERAPEERSQRDERSRTETQVESFTHPYAHTISVSRQITSATGTDPIGVNNLHDQPAVPVKTAFAAVWDRMASSNANIADVRAAVQQAVAQDANLARPELVFDEQNRKGLAEGGVLNVFEHTRHATIRSHATTVIREARSCVERRDWNIATQSYGGWYATAGCGGWSEVGRSTTYTNNGSLTMPQLQAFFQVLTVHCNPVGAQAANRAMPLASVTTGPNGQYVMATPRQASVPAIPIFGDTRNADPALTATGHVAFYTMECEWSCTASPAAADGASNNNGALTNVRRTGSLIEGSKFGAVHRERNGNEFTVFRDGQRRSTLVDVWYPRAQYNGGLVYRGEAPLRTTVTVWGEGTPTADAGKFAQQKGGLFSVWGIQGIKSTKLLPAATSTGWRGAAERLSAVNSPTTGTCIAQFGTDTGLRNTAGDPRGNVVPQVTVGDGGAAANPSNLVFKFVRATAG